MLNILITGGNGFVGKHVVKSLSQSNYILHTPTSKQLNLLNQDQTIDFVRDINPDIILHMAAVCAGILGNKNRPADFLYANTQMALNVYEAARINNIKTVYSLGSVCMYPTYCPTPFKEDDIWNGAAEPTNFPYSQGKRTLLMLGQTYREQYGIKGAHLIPVNLYGPGDNFDPVTSHVVPALIKKFDDAIEKYLPIVECWGSGNATRELLNIHDLTCVLTQVVESKFDSHLPINIGVGKDILIKDLAILIKELTGFTGDIVFNNNGLDGQPKRLLDVSRAKQLLNWTAKTGLRDGLKETIEWYRNNKK